MLQSFNAHILFFIFLQFLCLNHLKKIIQVNTLQQLFADRVPPFPFVGSLGPTLLISTNKSLDFKKSRRLGIVSDTACSRIVM